MVNERLNVPSVYTFPGYLAPCLMLQPKTSLAELLTGSFCVCCRRKGIYLEQDNVVDNKGVNVNGIPAIAVDQTASNQLGDQVRVLHLHVMSHVMKCLPALLHDSL